MGELAGQLDVFDALGELAPVEFDWVSPAVDRWLGTFSVNTAKAYSRDVAAWQEFLAGIGVRLQDARPADAEAWVALGAGLDNPAGATVRRRLAACSSLYAHLGLADPFAKIARPTGQPQPCRVLTRPELEKLRAAAATMGLRDQVWMGLALAGVSRAKAVQLDADAVEALPPDLAPIVADYLGDRTGGPLLANANGGRVDPAVLSRVVQRCATLADLEAPDQVTPRVLVASVAALAI